MSYSDGLLSVLTPNFHKHAHSQTEPTVHKTDNHIYKFLDPTSAIESKRLEGETNFSRSPFLYEAPGINHDFLNFDAPLLTHRFITLSQKLIRRAFNSTIQSLLSLCNGAFSNYWTLVRHTLRPALIGSDGALDWRKIQKNQTFWMYSINFKFRLNARRCPEVFALFSLRCLFFSILPLF